MSNPPIAPPGTIFTSSTTQVVPNIPKATDLNSALSAIAALTQAVYVMANAIPAAAGSQSANANNQSVANQPSAFVVKSQQLATIRVSDPNDASVFVDVTQIVALTLYNPTTKETWEWSQSSPNRTF